MLINKKRAEEIMDKYGIKALIATSPSNVFYTSDLCPYGRCFVVLPYEKEVKPAIIAPISGVVPVVLMSPPWISDVRYYGEFYTETRWAREPLTVSEQRLKRAQESWEEKRDKDGISVLIKLLEERCLKRGKIGVDEMTLPQEGALRQRLKHSLPGIEVVSAQEIFREIRMIKTNEEIKRLQRAIAITEKAWGIALEQAVEGITEREFADTFEHTIISEGGRIISRNGMYGPPISFGYRTAFVDITLPSEYRLKKGDLIRLDGGAWYMGYPSDIARTAVLGQPSEKQTKYYNAILKGQQVAIDMARLGVKASELFSATMDAVRREGLLHFKRHHCGHGLGIEGYDPPLISPQDSTPLEEGMVLCVETPYYELGFGGLIVEDTIVITENEPRYLTRSSRELFVI